MTLFKRFQPIIQGCLTADIARCCLQWRWPHHQQPIDSGIEFWHLSGLSKCASMYVYELFL